MPDRSIHSPLEARRQQLLARERADAALRAAKQSDRSPRRQIEQGLREPPPYAGQLSEWVNALHNRRCDGEPRRRAVEALLFRVADVAAKLLERREDVYALGRLAKVHERWTRAPHEWRPRSHNAARQFSSLARHLLARYPVPIVFDLAFYDHAPATAPDWFVHVGGGGNLRTAAGLPFPLTKMMAHHALLAPADFGVVGALRYGQVRGAGGSHRLALAVCATRLAAATADEPFWLTVVQFFAGNPMLDPHQVGPIVDYLHNQRFERGPARVVDGAVVAGAVPQPNLTMKGRSVESLLRQVQQWHRQLARENKAGGPATCWRPSGIAGYERVEGMPPKQRLFRVVELLTSRDLHEEGRAMRHCVGSYAASCERGRCAIFSLREDDGGGLQRRLTVEVIVQNRRIVQARGRFNAPPQGVDERILRAWATTARLSIAPVNGM